MRTSGAKALRPSKYIFYFLVYKMIHTGAFIIYACAVYNFVLFGTLLSLVEFLEVCNEYTTNQNQVKVI